MFAITKLPLRPSNVNVETKWSQNAQKYHRNSLYAFAIIYAEIPYNKINIQVLINIKSVDTYNIIV